MKLIPEETRIQQINALPNISFVRWEGSYRNSNSKAVCRCELDGYEWSSRVHNLLNGGRGCPQCVNLRRWTACERIAQINALPDIEFVRWDGGYLGSRSKAVCRCLVDGFEWSSSVNDLVNNRYGCMQCGSVSRATKRRTPANERIAKINSLPDITFVRWADGSYINAKSKAICRCAVDGCEWAASVCNLLNHGQGCPKCTKYGYTPAKPATLYILRSECGSMVKIGISNDHIQRHAQLRRNTPFEWNCIELLHDDDGSLIAEWEKELHSFTEPASFLETFDGYTEWRKWDDRLPRWIKRYRARLARYNKAP